MLTRLREIVEKVASAPRLNEALNILVTDICLAMETEVCSVYLADHDRRCYYLMATRGLKKPRGRTVTLAFDEGIVGLVGRLAEPINLADAQKHPSFKYIPSVKEERFRAFLGVPIIQRRQLLGGFDLPQMIEPGFGEHGDELRAQRGNGLDICRINDGKFANRC